MSATPEQTEDAHGSTPHTEAQRWLGIRRSTLAFVAVAIIPIAAFIADHWPDNLWPNGRTSEAIASEVRKCMSAHDLERTYVVSSTSGQGGGSLEGAVLGTQRFQWCAWPPPPGADVDGYSEIVAYDVRAFQDSTEAEGLGFAHRISAPCDHVELQYTPIGMLREPLDPLLVERGQVLVQGTGEVWAAHHKPGVPFYFDRGDIIVFHNGKAALGWARCAQ